MQAVRQAASGFLYAIVSLALVIGSGSLALAQGDTGPPSPGSFTALATSTTTRGPTTLTATASLPPTPSATPSPTQAAPSSTYEYRVTLPPGGPSNSTPWWGCEPPQGWPRAYVVRPGETLFAIASAYGISVELLQRANCRPDTVIFPGEWLWVPHEWAPVPALTIDPVDVWPPEAETPNP